MLWASLAAVALVACVPAVVDREPEPSISQTPPVADLARFYEQRLDWVPCDDAECASLQVPVDYSEPDGATVDLALLRVPAGDGSRGALVVNPGGPGSSGVDYARAARIIASDAVRDSYDIVGFDPRGVGRSSPVECASDADFDRLIAIDATPDTPAEVTELLSTGSVLGCSAPTEGLIEHLSTLDSARDLDVLRAALGESRLDYLGVSYGTHLGATYAAIFPDRVGRFVLDGPLPADLDAEELALGQALGFEDSLRRFVDYCQRDAECPLGGPDIDTGMQRLRALLNSLDAAPAPTSDADRPMTEATATYAILMSLYRVSDRPLLRDALASLAVGDGTPLMRMLDERIGRTTDGAYRDNALDAFYAVSCRDRAAPSDIDASVARLSAAAPFLGEYLAWGNLPCAGISPTGGPVTAPDAPAVLVVATTHDPATPLAWAEPFAGQFAEAVVIVRDGDGHTGYREGSECIDAAVDAFFLDGVLPVAGIICD
jgi:pimeloyl-ACP methyl ester carboxylesterase